MTFPQPTRRDHNTFCHIEGWREVHNARGGTVRHHITYELDLATGEVLRTRISRPVSGDPYGPALWQHILREQLRVDEPTFWDCVRHGVRPSRGMAPPTGDALPVDLARLLIHRIGLADTEVAAMTRDQAIARISQYWVVGE